MAKRWRQACPRHSAPQNSWPWFGSILASSALTGLHILVGDRDDKAKMHLPWAVMSAVLSSFHLLSTGTPVKQFHHPELHHRIQHLLLRFDFSEERLQAYFHGLCFEVLMSIFAIPWEHPSEGYDTYVELLQSLLDQLDAALGPAATTPLKRSRVS